MPLADGESVILRDRLRYAFDRPSTFESALKPRGWLFLTDQRVHFKPDKMSAMIHGVEAFSVPIADIRSVGQGTDAIGLNPSLQFRTSDELFVFWMSWSASTSSPYEFVVDWLRALRRLHVPLVAPNALDPSKPPVTSAVTEDASDRR
jgi:hypothetical protein